MPATGDAAGHMIFLAGVPAGTFRESCNVGQGFADSGVFLQEH
jgi:hypothetical protein